MGVIITHSILGIEVGTRNSLNLLIYKSNFDVLKNKIDKPARKEFGKRKLPLMKARGKKNKEKDGKDKRRKVRVEIRQ
jgi:hypothetical protein